MKKVYLIGMMLLQSFSLMAGNISDYVLDNYLIPLNQKGVQIARVYPTPSKVKLVSDTASIFRIVDNTICLKKNKSVSPSATSFRYGVTLDVDGNMVELDLVADGFSRNKIIAHRGVWKRPHVLQNSVRSFEHAVELGCEGSEMDVWLTADNKVILSHDPHIYNFEIEKSTSLQLFAGTIHEQDPIPSLQELLQVAGKQNITHPVIEIKDSQLGLKRTLELTDSVVSIVHRMKMQGFVKYISFNYEVLKRIRQLDPTAVTMYLWEGKKTLSEVVSDKISGIDYSFYAYQKDNSLIKEAHAAGLLTNVWTVNKPEDLLYYYQSGVDYITTDEPELLLKIINSTK